MTKKQTKTQELSKDEQLQEIGRNAMASIAEMVAALECDYERLEELDEMGSGTAWNGTAEESEERAELREAAGDCESREDAEQRIQEDPLSLEFRSGWVTSRDEMQPEEFCLLLGTGGPAVRIVGEINQGEPSHVRLETQDWYTPWTQYLAQDTATLETYCRCFCFDL